MSDVTVEQHIFLRSQLKLSSDDITDFDVFRGQSPAVKAKVLGPVTDCTPYAVLYCILFIFDSFIYKMLSYRRETALQGAL